MRRRCLSRRHIRRRGLRPGDQFHSRPAAALRRNAPRGAPRRRRRRLCLGFRRRSFPPAVPSVSGCARSSLTCRRCRAPKTRASTRFARCSQRAGLRRDRHPINRGDGGISGLRCVLDSRRRRATARTTRMIAAMSRERPPQAGRDGARRGFPSAARTADSLLSGARERRQSPRAGLKIPASAPPPVRCRCAAARKIEWQARECSNSVNATPTHFGRSQRRQIIASIGRRRRKTAMRDMTLKADQRLTPGVGGRTRTQDRPQRDSAARRARCVVVLAEDALPGSVVGFTLVDPTRHVHQ